MNRIRRWLPIAGTIAVLAMVWAMWELREVNRFNPQINAAARRYHVDPALVKAVVWRESKFRPGVRGSKGELGLMQVLEPAAREWAEDEGIKAFRFETCLDPGTNILAGTYYLSKLLKRYPRADSPVPYALADYNAGRGNVLRWVSSSSATDSRAFIRDIGFPGTKAYVKSILRHLWLYHVMGRFATG